MATLRFGTGRQKTPTAGTSGPQSDVESVVSGPATLHAPRVDVSPHYNLPPTTPSPYTPTLDASLEKIFDFALLYPHLRNITTILAEPPSTATNWPELLHPYITSEDRDGRNVMEELLFLVTRSLLPNQIAENRAFLTDLYDTRRNVSMRLLLRYDLLRPWKKAPGGYYITVRSIPADPAVTTPPTPINPAHPFREPLIPNAISTMIAAPVGGYPRKTLADKMKHHVTALDDYLVLDDETVERWPDILLEVKLSGAILMWQWLRQNNGVLDDMLVADWDPLMGENGAQWFLDP